MIARLLLAQVYPPLFRRIVLQTALLLVAVGVPLTAYTTDDWWLSWARLAGLIAAIGIIFAVIRGVLFLSGSEGLLVFFLAFVVPTVALNGILNTLGVSPWWVTATNVAAFAVLGMYVAFEVIPGCTGQTPSPPPRRLNEWKRKRELETAPPANTNTMAALAALRVSDPGIATNAEMTELRYAVRRELVEWIGLSHACDAVGFISRGDRSV